MDSEGIQGQELQGNNEEWLVSRAKQCLKTNPYAAKAWLLTARTLFPKNFAIQFEAYCIEKNGKNTKDVAKIMEEMFLNFPQEAQLWQEVKSYSEALQSESTDDKTVFLKNVFAALPGSLQYHMLVNVADTTQDILQQCRLMLVILNRYPDQVPDQGVKLIDSLITTEKQHQPPSPVNCYRKYLVCHVLPQVLKCGPQISAKHLYRWLQKAIEFYVCYITHPPLEDIHSPQSAELQSPSGQRYNPGVGRKVVIPGLSEKDSHIEAPWEDLFSLLESVGNLLDWDMAGFFGNNSCGSQWSRIQTVWESTTHQSDSAGPVKQVFYCATVLFLHCLYKYSSHVDPSQFTAPMVTGSNFVPVVLIEALKTDMTSTEHKSKKLKKDLPPPTLCSSASLSNSSDLTDTFLTALHCWELLHSSETLGKDFSKLLQHWKSDTWPWLRSFETDVLIYQGYFKEAIAKLTTQSKACTDISMIRCELQVASCHYCLENYSLACEQILRVVGSLPLSTEPSCPLPMASSLGRQLLLLACKETEILPYCIQLLITCFKEKAFNNTMPDDMSLGHMIVLLQFDWPRSEALFCDIIHKIQKQGTFTYNTFFNYVINIDILEEFAFLKTQEGGRVNVDILPTSTKHITQTRTVTRGVNKGVKEDFKVTLEKQVARSEENVESVIRHFFVEESDLLQKHLASR